MMGRHRVLVALAVAGLWCWAQAAAGHSYRLGNLAVGHIWAPPPEAGAEGVAVYGPILNGGKTAVRLVGASSPIAEQARFRVERDGIVHRLNELELLPQRPLALAPWRAHVWLTGVRRHLDAGDAFDLTLDFGEAGSLTVKVVVESAAGH